jgi:hypothetical protein
MARSGEGGGGGSVDLRVVPSVMARSLHLTATRLQLAVWLLVLNVADVALTRAVLVRGGVESNPVMQGLMAGLAAPLGLKLATAAFAGGLLLCCPHDSRFADRAAAAVVGCYVAVVMWNTAVLGWITLQAN